MSQKTIDSKNLTIEKIFEDFYIIPDYQREYIWREKEVSDLLDDVYREFSNKPEIDSNEYFLGSIVVCPSYDNDDNIYEVIDGQQRLTTLYIFFSVIKNYINQLDNHQAIEGIKKLIFSNYTNSQGQDVSKYRVNPQYKDSSQLLEKFSKDEFKIVDLTENVNITESFKNLKSAYSIIEKFIEETFEQDETSIRRFYAHLIKKVKLDRVETTDTNHALRVFETINNRGVGLDSMDLLKNLLFKQVKPEEFGEISKKWKEIKDELALIQEKPINFLRYFILSQYKAERDEVQSKEYQWLLDNKSLCKYGDEPNNFVEKILKIAKLYVSLQQQKNLQDKSENYYLANIKYLIPNVKQHLFPLLAAIDFDENNFKKLCFEIENFLFIYTFLGKKINELEIPFIKLAASIKQIEDTSQSEEIGNFIKQNVSSLKNDLKNEFIDKFKDLSQLDLNSRKNYKEPKTVATKKTKYILAKLSQYIQLSAYPNINEYLNLKTFTQSDIEIEHILPQDLQSEAVKNFDNSTSASSFIYKFGNLCLLEKSHNASNQNKCFEEKKSAYKNSFFLFTKSIVEIPEIGKNTAINRAVEKLQSFDTWNSQSINQRQEIIANIASQIWYDESEKFFGLLNNSQGKQNTTKDHKPKKNGTKR